jgi:carboxylate-amine ligase
VASSAATLGVEEELFLVDPETWQLTPGVERILGPAGLKTELFSCFVETNTGVCRDVHEVLAELTALRRVVRDAAAREGLASAAAGAHPFARSGGQEIVQKPRYLALLAERPKARRQLVCGLHVHVGTESLERIEKTISSVESVTGERPNPTLTAIVESTVSPFLTLMSPVSGRSFPLNTLRTIHTLLLRSCTHTPH